MISLHVEPIPYSGLVVVQTLTNLLPALSKSTVSPTLFRFFLLLFSEIQCSPVDMSVYPHYLHYMFGFLSHPLGCFFFAGFCIVTIVSKVRLRPEFKEMWALMKGLTESGETLLLGWCMEISGKTAGPRCHLFR